MKLINLVDVLFQSLFFYKTENTIRITASKLNTRFLKEGTHRYLVYLKSDKTSLRTHTQILTRAIKRTTYSGAPAIEVTQVWEDKDSNTHLVRSVSAERTMQPLYHKAWWKIPASMGEAGKSPNEAEVELLNKSINYQGVGFKEADAKPSKLVWSGYQSSTGKFFLNWHLGLETFPLLPYKKGVTLVIPLFYPGTSFHYQEVAYTVTGSGQITGNNNQKIDCWLLVHESKDRKEVFWISKKTKEVLALEQEINGSFYRCKIRLGYSMQ